MNTNFSNPTITNFMMPFSSTPEAVVEDEKPKEAPVFVSQPEAQRVEEGEPARFCTRVTGYPRPRVMWLINGHTIVNVSRQNWTL